MNRPSSRQDVEEMPLRCQEPHCFNPATGRWADSLICDTCNRLKRQKQAEDGWDNGWKDWERD